MRIGFGYDSHRFTEEPKPLVLGGVGFEGEKGLKAHSDGDVVIHAIIDALLGAMAKGNIGSHFPDTDERWKGADSTKLLGAVVEEMEQGNFNLGNLDVTIICERPKIGPKVEAIVDRLSAILHAEKNRISIKGKTNEKMDDVGAGIGIEVHAVCLLEEGK